MRFVACIGITVQSKFELRVGPLFSKVDHEFCFLVTDRLLFEKKTAVLSCAG